MNSINIIIVLSSFLLFDYFYSSNPVCGCAGGQRYLRARMQVLAKLVAIGDLFPPENDSDRALQDALEKAIDDVVAAAPKRFDEVAGHHLVHYFFQFVKNLVKLTKLLSMI